jgi:hypothetical protein
MGIFKLIFTLTNLVLLSTCSHLFRDSYTLKIKSNKALKIAFTHNIEGEVASCGCSKNPLGGVDRLYASLNSLKKNAQVIYLDLGDTFFNLNTIPSSIEKSSKFTAEKLATFLSQLDLNIFVPGEKDFALGINYLNKLIKLTKAKLLLTNSDKLDSLKYLVVEQNSYDIIFISVLDPEIVSTKYQSYFSDPTSSIEKIINNLSNISNKPVKIFLLSHTNMSNNILWAKKFPQIAWILGSHSNQLIHHPKEVSNTKIVQVLNRNQYLGVINLNQKNKNKSIYEAVPLDAGKEKLIHPNPMISQMIDFQNQLNKIHEKESHLLTPVINKTSLKIQTYHSCIDCHQKQYDFWKQTPHALAYLSLVQKKQALNPQCINCHSLQKDFPQAPLISQHPNVNIKSYIESLNKNLVQPLLKKQSIRNLSSKKRVLIFEEWKKLDQKVNMQNYLNIQCLHCHKQSDQHPFDFRKKEKISHQQMIKQCIRCHDQKNSPSWYKNFDSSNLMQDIHRDRSMEKLKSMSCPKIEDE